MRKQNALKNDRKKKSNHNHNLKKKGVSVYMICRSLHLRSAFAARMRVCCIKYYNKTISVFILMCFVIVYCLNRYCIICYYHINVVSSCLA